MMDRRSLMTAALATIAAVTSNRQSLAQVGMSRITAYAFSFPGLAGGDIRLSEFAGRPLLIVNTASLCGFTPQYGGLQELWTEFGDRGLMIIGVPPTISAARSRAVRPKSPQPRRITTSPFRSRPRRS